MGFLRVVFYNILIVLVSSLFSQIQATAVPINYREFGYYRVAAATPKITIGDPKANIDFMLDLAIPLAEKKVDVVVFPEAATTGYTAKDLKSNSGLLHDAKVQVKRFAESTAHLDTIFVVGSPYQHWDGRKYNVAFVIYKGKIIGAVPKTWLPNYSEFEDERWYISGKDLHEHVHDEVLGRFFLGPRQLFRFGKMVLGGEICEDVWGTEPVSTQHALAGANVIFNPSASNETIGKPQYRVEMINQHASRINAGYIYASSGFWESSDDIVFGGDNIISENGNLLARAPKLFSKDPGYIITEIDIDHLIHERSVRNTTFGKTPHQRDRYMVHTLAMEPPPLYDLQRKIDPFPFVPSDPKVFDERATQILAQQAAGLAREVIESPIKAFVLGVSGGLDSTWAFIVMIEAAKILGWSPEQLYAITMPGEGTTAGTRSDAQALAESFQTKFKEIPIGDATKLQYFMIGHDGITQDATFENVPARERTEILFNISNQVMGIVVGTGCMSESYLGWCTVNGDHQSGYHVSSGVPKTLIKRLVQWYRDTQVEKGSRIEQVLSRIHDRAPSPELLKEIPGQINPSTEDRIGSYVYHDFMMNNLWRYGFSPGKSLVLGNLAYKGRFTPEQQFDWANVNIRKFFSNQHKRSDSPVGPKIGSFSLSPRGDLRLSNRASCGYFIRNLHETADRYPQLKSNL